MRAKIDDDLSGTYHAEDDSGLLVSVKERSLAEIRSVAPKLTFAVARDERDGAIVGSTEVGSGGALAAASLCAAARLWKFGRITEGLG